MDMLKKFFPFSFAAKDGIVGLVINLLIYFVAGAVIGVIMGILGLIPFIGAVIGIVGWIVEVYVGAGMILSLLDYFKVLK